MDNPDGELSVSIVDDPEIEKLNREYLNRSGPTNVIAFPMQEGDFPDINPHLLGDVVISIETAFRESENAGTEAGIRLDELLVHGILHLFGYDHEHDPVEAEKMEAKSRELMDVLKKI